MHIREMERTSAHYTLKLSFNYLICSNFLFGRDGRRIVGITKLKRSKCLKIYQNYYSVKD